MPKRHIRPALGLSAFLIVGTLSAAPSSTSLWLGGLIKDASNQPLGGVLVKARQGDQEASATSDERGAFKLKLGPGTWKCTLSREGYTEQHATLDLDGKESLPIRRFTMKPLSGAVVEVFAQGEEISSLRTQTPLLEVPQAIQYVDQALIQSTGSVRIDKAYDYISGISRQNSFGGLWDNYAIRGFAGNVNTGPNVLRNGFAGN